MSVKVMTAVFERYPSGGGEMLLALALADHASDDGTRVFPSVAALAEKTRQSARSVQYQLRRMEESGWLILVGAGNGGRSMSREYRISLDWIKGAEIAPFQKGANDDVKGANDDTKGCNPRQERVHHVAPANNHQGTIKESSGKQGAEALAIPQALLDDFLVVRKARRAGPLTKTAMDGLQREASKAGITLVEAVTACCEFGWQGFNAGWYAERTGGGGRGAAPGKRAEPEWRAEQKNLIAEHFPNIAARSARPSQIIDMETQNGHAIRLD